MRCFSAFFAIAAMQFAAITLVSSVGEEGGESVQTNAARAKSPERLTLSQNDEAAITALGQFEHDLSHVEPAAALRPTIPGSQEWVFVSRAEISHGEGSSLLRSLPVKHVLNEPREMVGAVYRFTYVEAANDDVAHASEAVRYSF
jgi:hypothetical protein